MPVESHGQNHANLNYSLVAIVHREGTESKRKLENIFAKLPLPTPFLSFWRT